MGWLFRLIDISVETANRFYTFGWSASLIGAAITFIGVVFLMWGTRVRDRDFDNNIAALHDRAANSESETEKLKAANLVLQAKIQPRRLSGDDSAKITAALSRMQPLPIGVVSRLFDTEGSDFADDLAKAFSDAHWQAVRQRDWTMSNRGAAFATLVGTVIPPELSTALLAALSAGDVKATITTIQQTEQNTTSAHFQPNGLYLLIGAKP
jgi:hypothetical protein